MSSELKSITLYGGGSAGPNPWKIAMFLAELDLPYEFKPVPPTELKQPPYTDLNPNGRTPTIFDPNTDTTLWESGAIIEYLIDTYDNEKHRLSYSDITKHHLCRQWLFFQVSGQGPYYGQKIWFSHAHAEKNITSAIERYANETKRVVGVLNTALERNGTGYLVGDKYTFADLCFVAWDAILPMILGDDAAPLFEANPAFKKWHDSMMARPAIDNLWKEWEKYIAAVRK